MDSPLDERPRGRRRFRALAAVFTATLVAAGVSAVVLSSTTASAAPITFSQCNGVNNGGGETVDCHVIVVNTITDDPLTTGSVITVNGVAGSFTNDVVTRVEQCNTSARGGGATLNCSVSIVNNIAIDGAIGATAATVNQCTGNQPDGLGTAPNTCSPASATGSGATIFQCSNRTGNGGGLVTVVPLYSHCEASGSISSSFPVTINQCNEDSADGGDARVRCTASITTNVVDTLVTGGGTPTGGSGTPTGGSGTPTGGTPTGGTGGPPVRPVTGTPRTAG